VTYNSLIRIFMERPRKTTINHKYYGWSLGLKPWESDLLPLG